ncbi:MAG: ADP-ribosylglycohydrolase family protein [Elusimicrobia bacterium]|nr:ADP-ribosylglycohydrolase family protein [Candidatus Liberimonas magnetica]
MIGAIAGDIIGSKYEFNNIKTKDFPLFSPGCDFTDDSVLTVAVADCIINKKPFAKKLQEYFISYPGRGYGGNFASWARYGEPEPYYSWGNGSAMRVSPVGFAYNSIEKTLDMARKSAEITHNHPEGIKGAEATAAAIFIARTEKNKTNIKNYIKKKFGYDLSSTVEDIRPDYTFNGSCQGTVPQAIIAFLDSTDFEDALRNAVSIGGDSDTLACITGGIAEAYYGSVPDHIKEWVKKILEPDLWNITEKFYKKYSVL